MKISLYTRWLTIPLFISAALMVTGCGDDEPDDPQTPVETPDNKPDEPDTPDTPDTPDEPDTPDTPDEPDTPDTPAYTIPTEDELVGQWKVYKQYTTTWRCLDGATWKNGGTKLEEGDFLDDQRHTFPYTLGFIKYNDNGKDRTLLVWGWWNAVNYYSQIVTALNDKESGKFDNFNINNGIPDGKYMTWTWNPEIAPGRTMLILKNNSGTVSNRWEISHYDGDTFIQENYFSDKPKPVEGGQYYTYKRYYRRIGSK